MTALFHVLALFLAMGQGNTPRQVVPGCRISGVVVDAVTTAPIPRAQVSIFLNNEEIATATGDDGRFSLDGVPAGKYVLNAVAPGYVREAYNQHGEYSTAIATGNGQDSEHVVFRLHPQAVIYGRASDERGEAVRGAQVQLFAIERPRGSHAKYVQAQTQTNDLGEYRFPHLLPGKYYFAVQARPWYAETQLSVQRSSEGIVRIEDGRSLTLSEANTDMDPLLDVVYPITFYPGVTDERSSTELVLRAGEGHEANITLQAVPATRLRLTGLPADGRSSISVGASQRVYGTSSFGLGIASGQIAPGEYEIAGLPPGDLTLVVTANKGNESTSRTIDLDSRGTLDASGLQATAKVSGKVFVEGAPEGNAGFVSLISSTMPAQPVAATTQLQKDGTFSFPEVQAGTYKMDVNLHSGGYYVQKVSGEGAKPSGREITIAGGKDVDVMITMAQGQGQVTGVVQGDGKPVAGAMVLLVPESSQEMEEDSRMDQSDSDGTFTLSDVVPGRYTAIALQNGWEMEWASPEALRPYLAKGTPVVVKGKERLEIKIAAQ